MVRTEKQALQSLHRVLIEARLLALEGQAASDIAEALDWAELLPGYISVKYDQTNEFRNALKALVESHPRFTVSMHFMYSTVRRAQARELARGELGHLTH